MNSNPSNPSIEVEAKFLGGEPKFQSIVEWLEKEEGGSVAKKPPVHRIHVYFDDGFHLLDAGCRLRCVIAAGEWCRYDFKAADTSDATLEVSIRKNTPARITEIIDQLAEKVPEGEARCRLQAVRNTARMLLALVGDHQKAIFRGPALELELSWDVLTSLESGASISEIEVELISGARSDFDSRIARMADDLNLKRIYGSKLERLLETADHGNSVNGRRIPDSHTSDETTKRRLS